VAGSHGLIIIYYGNGKGKTTAAMGLAVRAAGTGRNVFVVQFVKGTWPSGERTYFEKHGTSPPVGIGKIEVRALGTGFVGILGDKKPFSEHQKSAKDALAFSQDVMQSGKYSVVILDEIVSAIEIGLLTVKEVRKLIQAKPANLTVVLTGHKKYKDLVALADIVTEMHVVKHPYYEGRLAQHGIDY
jgi:cob(I)alamin adenosyltransferase